MEKCDFCDKKNEENICVDTNSDCELGETVLSEAVDGNLQFAYEVGGDYESGYTSDKTTMQIIHDGGEEIRKDSIEFVKSVFPELKIDQENN